MATTPRSAKSIFLEAVEKHQSDKWEAFLDGACGGDAEMRLRVEGLLKAHRESDSILDQPEATVDFPRGESQPGAMIGRYRLMEQIGEGGMGTVFVAEQQKPLRRKVALKVIKPGMDSKAVIARFEAERQALAMMDHPNIAKVLDAGTTETGRPYFVMELVKGQPITEYCDELKLPIRERLELFSQVCQAIQHAHQKAIIHRDIKPSNVLVTERDGKAIPVVIDFGVAKALNQTLTDRTVYTSFQSVIGTPLYMSPEQAKLSSVDVDTRSDVYSLGVLLYELLVGVTPFEKERLAELALEEACRVVREEEPPKPSGRISSLGDTATTIAGCRQTDPKKLHQFVRGDLDWVVLKCLEKDRGRRYDSANEVAKDIERHLTNQPVLACPPSAWYRLHKFVQRNASVVAVSAVIAALVFLGVGGICWQYRRAQSTLVQLNSLAFQQALSAALTADQTKTEQGLRIAEATGASPAQLQVLQGLSQYTQGNFAEARQSCTTALRLDPNNYIAQAIFAKTSVNAGFDDEFPKELAKLIALRDPETDEERLMLAANLIFADPRQALRQLELVSDANRSPLKLAIWSEANLHLAVEEGNATRSVQSLQAYEHYEVIAGRGANSSIYKLLALTHQLLLARELGDIAAQTRLQKQADSLEETMAREFARDSGADFARWLYLRTKPDQIAAWEAIKSQGQRQGSWAIYVAADRLASGKNWQLALADFDAHIVAPDAPYSRLARAYLLADIPAESTYVDAVIRDLMKDESLFLRKHALYLLCMRTNLKSVQSEATLALAGTQSTGWEMIGELKCFRCLAGDISPEVLLKDAKASQIKQSAARFTNAMLLLADGKRSEAVAELEACVDANAVAFFEYELAAGLARRLSRNATGVDTGEPKPTVPKN